MNERSLHFDFPKAVRFCSQDIVDKWRELGFPTLHEASKWQNSTCGVACLKMALDTILDEEFNFYRLLIEINQSGGYREDVGWIHQALADKGLEKGVHATRAKVDSPKRLMDLLHLPGLLITSVGLGFKGLSRSGHLVIVSGYTARQTSDLASFKIYDPIGSANGFHIDALKFWKNFSENCIVLSTRK